MDNHDNNTMSNIDTLDASGRNPKSKQRISWAMFACLIAILMVIILNQTGFLPNVAKTLGSNVQKRDLSTPSSRLVGLWKNVDYNGEVYYSLIDPELRIGTYRLRNTSNVNFGPPIRFKILNEERSGDKLIIREFNDNLLKLGARIGIDVRMSDITCCIPKHGRSMTKEYTFGGEPILSVYRYVGDKSHP